MSLKFFIRCVSPAWSQLILVLIKIWFFKLSKFSTTDKINHFKLHWIFLCSFFWILHSVFFFFFRLRKMTYPQFFTLWENLCQPWHRLAFQTSLQQDQARNGFLKSLVRIYKFCIIVIRNHAPWSYMTWLPVTLTWLSYMYNLQ